MLEREGEIAEKVEDALGRVGLLDVKQRNATKLSEGQKRLLGLARALVIDPDLLLLDEPTSYLDPENAERVVSAISEISKEKTVVITDPNHSNAEKLSKRVVSLSNGRLSSS